MVLGMILGPLYAHVCMFECSFEVGNVRARESRLIAKTVSETETGLGQESLFEPLFHNDSLWFRLGPKHESFSPLS